MKRTASFFLLSVATVILHSNLHAQGRGSYSATTDVVTVNEVAGIIDNLYVMDSLKGLHSAAFELRLGNEEAKRICAYILSAAMGNQPLRMSLTKQGINQVIEERTFKSVFISEVGFSDFNQASRDVAKLKVKILAQDVSIKTNVSEIAGKQMMQDKNDKRANCNNFRLTLGNLPVQKISSISNIKFNNPGTNGYVNFTLDIARADAGPWKEWFYNGGGGKKEPAVLNLMDPGLTMAIISFQLSDVEIVSVSESNTSNQDGIAKTTIGLRTRRFEVAK